MDGKYHAEGEQEKLAASIRALTFSRIRFSLLLFVYQFLPIYRGLFLLYIASARILQFRAGRQKPTDVKMNKKEKGKYRKLYILYSVHRNFTLVFA